MAEQAVADDGRVLSGSPVVYVNGDRYVRAGAEPPSIGVGITTHDRRDTAEMCIAHWREVLPDNAVLVIVDDGSKVPFEGADHRFDKAVGVARAKNKCLELLHARGCQHLFLADDDIYPTDFDWWRPYVESREPHLMWIFDRPVGQSKRQVEILFSDDEIVAYHATRGCLIYVESRVLEKVGGMDPDFGFWGWEHQSWSDRIHSAGLTTARYMDVVNSSGLFYSLDQAGEVESTATDEARRYSEGPGLELRMQSRHSSRYIEYRELSHAVLTCLITDHPDPQRSRRMTNDSSMVEGLRSSVASVDPDSRLVVFHTGNLSVKGAEMVPVKQQINVYFERWLHYFRWLRDHPEVDLVWCVDATDVQIIRDPFPEMQRGHLYFGWEPKTLRDEWLLAQHPDKTLQEWMRSHPNLPLLNMGVVGGERDLVMAFAQRLISFYFDDHIDFILGWETRRVGVGDMAAGNWVARHYFSDVLDSGPHVTNVFKSEKVSPTAWWKHR